MSNPLPEDAIDEELEGESMFRESDEEFLEQIKLLEAEKEELKDQLLRTLADMQNMRKRFQLEADEKRKYATEQLVRELLPVLDNFERALAAYEQGSPAESVIEGVKAIERQLKTTLEQVQVNRIAAVGLQFDPEHHEAIGTHESDEHEEGMITREVEPGYKMADRVIRPARVHVAKKKPS